MSGMTDKLTGKAKEAMGKVTDNKRMEAEGKAQQVKGDIKQKFENGTSHKDEPSDHRGM